MTKLNSTKLWVFAALALSFASCTNDDNDDTSLCTYVNTFIGTGGHGHTYPGATMPFGMVQLSPDTRLEGWDGCSGYHYSDSVVYGFSHTHLSGTGVGDYGDVLLMPTVGEVQWNNGATKGVDQGYASRFTHHEEHASPGHYSVRLSDYDVQVDLTVTPRTGMHKYVFPKSDAANIIIDLKHRDKVLDSEIKLVGENTIEGFRRSEGWARDQHVYFVMEFSKPFAASRIAVNDTVVNGNEARGTHLKAAVTFATEEHEEVLVKVGISAVSIDGARKNLVAENSNWDFEAVRHQAHLTWDEALNKIVVEGGTEDQKTVFYTALYHTMIAPNLFMDVDGQYRGTDLQVHQADNTNIYTIFSLWDTFRATHPLYTIIERERTKDFINTFLAQYEDGGQLPVWELAGNYTGCMIGYHSVPVIADAYVKGITDFDAEKALEAMKHSANQDHLGLSSYKQYGYIPAGDEAESVSKTLEYAYDDWCIAVMANELGKEEDYQEFIKRGQYYKNIFDPASGFMRSKMNGGWSSNFDPAEVNFNFTEANSWQYSMFVPQDVQGMITAYGGRDAFEQKLDGLFSASSETTGRHQADITGLIGQYAHGNEPSHHMAYLYNYIGKPWKTQERVRQILDELYTNAPDGLSGNEDCGQMSAWYVLSAMGIYSVTPGLDYYAIGTPIFDKVTINLENGKQFVIESSQVSHGNHFVQSASLNGNDYANSYLKHSDIMNGGTLSFVMGESPNESWGAAEENIPVAAIVDHTLIPVPFVTTDAQTFTDSMAVSLGTACSDCTIRYQRNLGDTLEYTGPFTITETTNIRAWTENADANRSGKVDASFMKIKGGRSIVLGTEYANQYAAGGNNGLIDYLRGPNNFRTGYWQGYQDADLDATIDLGQVTSFQRIATGFLQDIKSWIWYPTEVEYAISNDGKNFTVVATIANDFSEEEYGSFTKEVEHKGSMKARYVRVRANNYGVCPDWHLGAGGKTWLFVDEIMID